MNTIVDEAVAAYEANAFWEAFHAGYERLAEDSEQRDEVRDERAGEAPALADRTDGS